MGVENLAVEIEMVMGMVEVMVVELVKIIEVMVVILEIIEEVLEIIVAAEIEIDGHLLMHLVEVVGEEELGIPSFSLR